jgi:hypothetical protein
MTLDDARSAVMTVLKTIQDRSGLPCPELDGTVIPPKILEKFDSTVWPAATTMIARALGVLIPHDIHIFGGEKGKPLLTIEQTANVICAKAQSKTMILAAA